MRDVYELIDLFPFMCACIKGKKNKLKRIDNLNRNADIDTKEDRMSKFLKEELFSRNRIMDNTIKMYLKGGKKYEGTNPMLDEAQLFEEQ